MGNDFYLQILNFVFAIIYVSSDIIFVLSVVQKWSYWTSLINFDRVPGGIISGKEGREVEVFLLKRKMDDFQLPSSLAA